MESPDLVIRELLEDDYGPVARIINEGYGKRDSRSLDWALHNSPVFRRDLSAVAELEGKIVGVWFTSIQKLKIGHELLIPAQSGLVVVHKDFRRRGIGSSLWRWRRTASKSDQSLLGFGLSTQKTRRVFWSRITKSSVVNDRAMVYTKVVAIKPIEDAVAKTNRDLGENKGRDSKGSSLPIRFEMKGLPGFTVEVWGGGVQLSDQDPSVTISGCFNSPAPMSIINSITLRRLRIRGIRHLPALIRYSHIIRRFAANISDQGPHERLQQ